jgi:hypothetical protein
LMRERRQTGIQAEVQAGAGGKAEQASTLKEQGKVESKRGESSRYVSK